MSERCACGAPLAEYGPCWIDGKPPAPLADGGKTVFDGYPLSRAEYVERIHEGGRGGYGIATHDVLMHHDAALRAALDKVALDAAKRSDECDAAEARAEKAEREVLECYGLQGKLYAAEARAEKLASALRDAERFIKWERLTASSGPILECIARALAEGEVSG